jgi:hypothetical protein
VRRECLLACHLLPLHECAPSRSVKRARWPEAEWARVAGRARRFFLAGRAPSSMRAAPSRKKEKDSARSPPTHPHASSPCAPSWTPCRPRLAGRQSCRLFYCWGVWGGGGGERDVERALSFSCADGGAGLRGKKHPAPASPARWQAALLAGGLQVRVGQVGVVDHGFFLVVREGIADRPTGIEKTSAVSSLADPVFLPSLPRQKIQNPSPNAPRPLRPPAGRAGRRLPDPQATRRPGRRAG